MSDTNEYRNEEGGGAIHPTSGLAREAEEATGINAMSCYQCGKCSAGCPLFGITDLIPHDLMRCIQLGLEDRVLRSRHIWLCVGCETCNTRCPNQIDIPRLMDYMRKRAMEKGVEAAEPGISAFHNSFLKTVKHNGRLSELGMMRDYKMKTGEYFKDFKLGMALFKRGKIKLFSRKAGRRDVRAIFERRGK